MYGKIVCHKIKLCHDWHFESLSMKLQVTIETMCNIVAIMKQGEIMESILHTTNWTKLLYWLMFLLRMSWQGPSTRSKRARSSLTHFRVDLAVTVAARGLFNSRAISPNWKEKERNSNSREYSIFWKILD